MEERKQKLLSLRVYVCFIIRLHGISLSFNGGKDCTVLLHLIAAVLSRKYPTTADDGFRLRTVFVTYPNPFPHVDAFVKTCVKRYRLDCVAIPGPMRGALQQFLDMTEPKPKAIFVGIRRQDPYAGEQKQMLAL